MKSVGQVYREQLIGEIKDKIENSNSTFLLSYTKLSGPKLNDLRRDLKKAGAKMFVARNSLASVALKELKQDEIVSKVGGQTAFIWSSSDTVEVSKVLVKFTKDSENIALRVGLFEGRILEKDDIKRLSELPSKQVLQSMLLGTMVAPVTRLLGAMNAKSRDLLSILKQLSEKKGGN